MMVVKAGRRFRNTPLPARLSNRPATTPGSVQERNAAVNSRLYHVRRFYYDTAASANPIAMQGLKTLLGGTSHIVFGTDLPYGTSAQMSRALRGVGFSPAELAGIERDNGLAVLPSYRDAVTPRE